MAPPNRIVVVGAGLAGLRTAKELRRLGHTGELTILGAEDRLPYDRPPLSKGILTGQGDDVPYLCTPDELADLGIRLRPGRRVVHIDSAGSSVVLSDHERIPYDAVVIAVGARPRSLPVHVDGPPPCQLRTYDDAVRLREAITTFGKVTIIGAGFIGCEVAASARSLGAEVTLVESLSAPLVRVLGPEVGREVHDLHVKAGVDVRCGTSVASIGRSRSGGQRILLTDGSEVDSNVTLACLGVEPEVTWLATSGIATGNGVLCDEFGRTSLRRIWAVGDVAAWRQPASGRHLRIEHWTTATEQASAVAHNVLCAPHELKGVDAVPYFWSDQYDLKIQSLGSPSAACDVEVLRVGADERLLALYALEERMIGAVGFGLPRQVMRMRSLLAHGVELSQARAALQ